MGRKIGTKLQGIKMISVENHKTVGRIENFLKVILFYVRLIIKENFVDYIKKWALKKRFENAVILGNGPSLNESLKKFDDEYISTHDFFAVNNFCTHEMYTAIKPRNYVLSDPAFFEPNNVKYAEIQETVWKKIVKDTDWEMNIFVPFQDYKANRVCDISQNPKLKIVPIHCISFFGYEKSHFEIYKKGLGNGEFMTVVLNALYIAIQLFYKEVDFYGIDHNFFDGLYVDENNVLYSRQTHFDEDVKKPLQFCFRGDSEWYPYTMEKFLNEKRRIFQGHRIMNAYAEICGCKVYNCTPNSLVDVYERKTI